MKFAVALSALLVASVPVWAQEQPRPAAYAEGQVWEYRNRPQDAGSLIKIQRIEPYGTRRVYHLTVIGVHLGKAVSGQVVDHIPVSQATLDASVTRLAPQAPVFPAGVDEGIAEWRRAKGGIFAISLADIVDAIAGTIPQG